MSYILGKRGNKWVEQWKPYHPSHHVEDHYLYDHPDFAMRVMGECYDCQMVCPLLLGKHNSVDPKELNFKDVELDCENRHEKIRHPVGISSISLKLNVDVGVRISLSAYCAKCAVSEPVPVFQGVVGVWQHLNAMNCCDKPQILFAFSEINIVSKIIGVEQDTINPRRDCAFCMDSDTEEADVTCNQCRVVYHEKCCVRWLEQQKYLPKNFTCVHCSATVTGFKYEKDPRAEFYMGMIQDYVKKLEEPPTSSVVAQTVLPNSYRILCNFLTFKTKEQAEEVMNGLISQGGKVKWNRNHLRHLRIQYEKYLKKNKLI